MSSEVRSYYGQPIVKRPEWTWEVPWYFFVGGLAGMSSVVAAVARLRGRSQLADRMRVVAGVGAMISPPLLISDLGRPKRFLNMLRVFKPTSAMSVGSWILAAYCGVASGAAVLPLLGPLRRLTPVAEAVAAAFGVPMATYTAVLVADTSLPVWHEARHQLPFLFGASAAASAGAAATLVAGADDVGPGRRLAVGAVAVEVATETAMRRRLGELADVYEEGDAGRFQRAAMALSVAGAVALSAGGGRRRPLARAGACLVLVGSVCQRWAVYRAGFQSAADPAHVVAPQRARLEQQA